MNEPINSQSCKTRVSGGCGCLNENVNECTHEYLSNYCNSDGSYSHTVCDDCNEILEI